LTPQESAEIERRVNAVIRQNTEAQTRIMPYDDAVASGAVALFGEKYDEDVRVLTMGRDLDDPTKPYSAELCGGTHVRRVGDIALFKVTSESAVAAGVRRIEALTGEAARLFLESQAQALRSAAEAMRVSVADLPARIDALVAERKKLERDLAEAKKQLAFGGGAGAPQEEARKVGSVQFIGRVLDGVQPKDLRGLIDAAKKKLGSGVVAYVGVNEGKAALAVGVTDDLKGKLSAVDLVRAGAEAVGGQGGGGRPDMAQAGGPDGAKASEAVEAIAAAIAAAA
jgi:alanyl-tRNA synthetase